MQKRYTLVPYLFLTISGACALVYEVTWARYLAFYIGHTTMAHMCVLAAFMGGLALGSIVIGRLTTRFRRPLAMYGVLELLIGAYALTSPLILGFGRSIMLAVGSQLEPGAPSWLAVKLLVSVLMLIVPTVLMGGTFPVMMKHFQPESRSADDKSAWLYMFNCVGGVAGSILAGFMLIPELGSYFTLVLVGTANMLLGACAAVLSWMGAENTPVPQPSADEEADSPAYHPLVVPVYIAIGVSGLVSMIYELVWIRIFAMTLGSSTYSFTLMLAAFISGISLGSLAVALIPSLRRNPLVTFAFAEIAIGIAVVLGIPLYERLPYIFWQWTSLLSRTEGAYTLLNCAKYSLCFGIMVVPTFFFGMTIPLAIKSVANRDERIGRDSGLIYGANTAGTLVGAVLTGLVLIRVLGLRHSLELALMLNIMVGVMLLLVSRRPYRYVTAGAATAVGLCLVLLMPAWHSASFVVGTFRQRDEAPESWEAYLNSFVKADVIFYQESDDGMVAVRNVKRGELSLFINGKADASSNNDLCTQIMIGQLPMFLKPDARDVLVVGLGSGISANSVLTHPGTRVDCVEISPSVVEAARYFKDHNGGVHDNERFNLIIEDARAYAAISRKKYDIVASEPTNPWIAGVGNLFSREYYQDIDKTLKPGGLMVQWIQRYEVSDELVQIMLRTLLTVFPYAYVFEPAPEDYIVIATREPLKPDFAAMARKFEEKAVAQDLARISVTSLVDILGRQTFSPDVVRMLVGKGRLINTDDYPVLEFNAPRAQFMGLGCIKFDMADQRQTNGGGLFIKDYLNGRLLAREETRSLIATNADERVLNPQLVYPLIRYYLNNWESDAWILSLYGMVAAKFDTASAARAASAIGDSSDPRVVVAQAIAAGNDALATHSAFTPQDLRPARAMLDKALKLDPGNQPLIQLRDRIVRLQENPY